MEFAFSAARWVVGKALAPVTDGLLEAWAASKNLGSEIDELMTELQYAQAMLNNTRDREIRNPALNDLLLKLRLLAYDADDVLDELDYFRIQDELDGTYHAAREHPRGCAHDLLLNARQTARHVANKFKLSSGSTDASRGASKKQGNDDAEGKGSCICGVLCSCAGRTVSSSPPSPTNHGDKKVGADAGCMPKVTSAARSTASAVGKRLPCCSSLFVDDDAHTDVLEDPNMPGRGGRLLCGDWPSKVPQRRKIMQTPKLKFNRVDVSTRMTDIIKKLKPICAKVSTILNLELTGSKNITTATMERPTTNEEIIEPKLYGRETEQQIVIDSITHGECFDNELTVLPIVGPGGIGKTAFTQHVYQEVKSHFQVTVWICVSLDFDANRLAQEAVKKMPKVNGEKKNCSDQERIEQRLKGKRFLLVLDDIWKYHEDEWEKLLAPFRKGGGKGNMVIVTTRMPDVAKMVKIGDSQIELDRLGAKDFRDFFDACVYTTHESRSDHPELHDIGEQIMIKLKCSPLAAKTVGRLLRKNLSLEHWRRVLESKEWELQTSDNDIMPALKISYDYLPIDLKQCFSYCALFPEDYEFDRKELIHFWIGLDVLHPGDQGTRIEDVGKSYLIDLVNYGFFKMNKKDNGRHCYVIHDLLHELAVKVSRYDCLSTQISKVRSVQIPASVRHLSIIVDNKDVEDRITYEDREKDLGALDKRLQVGNIRTLMLFGENVESFSKTFGKLFKQARALRTIFLSGASCLVEDMLQDFTKLVHLRYLRIKRNQGSRETSLPGTITRLYHLKILDIDGCSIPSRNLSNLINMQHFIVHGNTSLESDIVNVGNLKLLRELREFKAMKEKKGFELKQLAQLVELEVLGIYSLEKVEVKEEADGAKLMQKSHLRKLILDWDIDRSKRDSAQEEQILEEQGLRSLRLLWIGDCPRFLSAYSSTSSPPCFPFPTSLEKLSLQGAVGTETLLPLSNLTSLARLYIDGCGEPPRADGLRSLLAQGRLTKLTVCGTPSFFAGSNSEPSPPHEEESPSSSSRLQELHTDDIAGALAAPIWTLLSSSLTDLTFRGDEEMERFTEEHEEALRFLTSLERIKFWECDKLQSLPAGLHRLPKLKSLFIYNCEAIRSLPKDGLPSSLQTLVIQNCPAIRTLPKVDGLPSSLRKLDVRGSGKSEELRRQCRKLIGTIPVVYA